MGRELPPRYGMELPLPLGGRIATNGFQRAPRVCLLSREFQPAGGSGGIGTYVWNLARGLHYLGCVVEVLTSVQDSAPRWVLPGIRIWPVRPVRTPRLLARTGLREAAWRLAYSAGAARSLAVVQRDEPVLLVEAPEWGAEGVSYAMGRGGAPLVVRLHTPQWLVDRLNHRRRGVGDRVAAWLERLALLNADAVSTPSASLARTALDAQGIRPRAVGVVPNPVDTVTFSPGDAEPPPERVLYVGRLERRKGVMWLAQALPALRRTWPHVRCVLVGRDTSTGPRGTSYREYLVALLQGLGCLDMVDFLEPMPPHELAAEYRRSAVCVVPSVYEGFGYTCFEAMACGRPVVCTAAGGLAEWVRDGETGVLVPPGDPPALADAIARLLRSPGHRRELGQQARRWTEEELALLPAAERTLAFYRSVQRGR